MHQHRRQTMKQLLKFKYSLQTLDKPEQTKARERSILAIKLRFSSMAESSDHQVPKCSQRSIRYLKAAAQTEQQTWKHCCNLRATTSLSTCIETSASNNDLAGPQHWSGPQLLHEPKVAASWLQYRHAQGVNNGRGAALPEPAMMQVQRVPFAMP